MAFRRSAVRSRLAPPPHHRGRAAGAAAAPLLFLVRFLLAAALLGVAPGAAPPVDPALAMARAAGALCLGDGPDSLPANHAHDHCLACPGGTPASALAEMPTLPVPPAAGTAPRAAMPHAVPQVGWAAYASRAPPGPAG